MTMEKATFEIRSLSPLIMHSGQLADPLNEAATAVSDAVKVAKKNKTKVAWLAAYKAEFTGGLCLDENLEPCVPGEYIEAVIREGAKKTKQGKQVKAGIIVDGNFPLLYKGPRTVDALWDAKFYKTVSAKVGQNRVMRTRPIFSEWGCRFEVHFNDQLLSAKDLASFLDVAGREVGLGDWRPRYGRFEVVS
jgi:hypothetical protein